MRSPSFDIIIKFHMTILDNKMDRGHKFMARNQLDINSAVPPSKKVSFILKKT